jgi:putative serine protease PepD
VVVIMVGRLSSLPRGRFAQVKAATAVIGAAALLASAAVAGCAASDSGRTSLAAANAPNAPAAPAALGSGPADALQEQYEAVIKAALPSVVQISTSDATGSGVVYDDKGDIVTNAHVVGSASTVQVVTDVGGATLTAKVIGAFAPDDLAVIRVTSGAGSLHPAKFGQSEGVQAGQIVVALGSPLGLTGSATQGIISATGRTLIEDIPTGGGATTTATIADTLQTSAAINSGNSGGALVSLSGQVIGLPTATSLAAGDGNSTGIGFAIPSDTVTSIARQLIAAGQVTQPGRATLGISPRSAAASSGQGNGVTIATATAGGPAATAGLRRGDVITEVEGCPIRSEAQLAALLAALAPGMQLYLTYTRSGRAHTATVTLAASWS